MARTIINRDLNDKLKRDRSEVLKRAFFLFSVVFIISFYYRLADNDLFARVAVGRLVSLYGDVPRIDGFAFSPTKHLWVDHEWLSGVIFYYVSQLAGDFGLFLLDMIVAFATLYLIVSAQFKLLPFSKSGYVLLFFSTFYASFVWSSIVRSQIFTFLFFSALLNYLVRSRESGSTNIYSKTLLILIFMLWGNLHGGVVVGLGYLGIACIGALVPVANDSKLKTSSILFLMVFSSLALLINPYGIEYASYLFDAILMTRPKITEWSRIDLAYSNIFLYIIYAVTALCLISKSRSKIAPDAWGYLIVSLYFATIHLRLVPFYLFTASIYLPVVLSNIITDGETWLLQRLNNVYRVVRVVSVVLAATCLVMLGYLILSHDSFKLNYTAYPVQAMEWLRSNAGKGNILVHFNEGSYVLMKGHPQFKVSIDGRYEEVYSNDTFERALAALNPSDPSFLDSFNALNPDFVLLCRTSVPHEVATYFPGDWRQVFLESTGNCAVYVEAARASRYVSDGQVLYSDNTWLLNF